MRISVDDHDSPLGAWSHRAYRPPHLAGAVEKLWHSEGALAHRGERLLPSATAELLVILGDPFRVVGPHAGRFGGACLSGVLAGPLLIEQPARHSVLGVRLRPWAARGILGAPPAELDRPVIALGDALGRAAAELAERCHEARSTEELFRVAEAFVTERLAGSTPTDPGIARSAARIQDSHGLESVAGLRAATGLSKGRFVAAFRTQVGVAPKRYARLLRFRHAAALLDTGAGSFGDVAQRAGYYDQPHMNADFRELAGYPPGRFLARRYNGVTAAEPDETPSARCGATFFQDLRRRPE